MKYVNSYHVTREYGGPEEGGWYHDMWWPLACVPILDEATDEQIEHLIDELNKKFEDEDDGRDLSSVISTGIVQTILEDSVPEQPQMPRYE